MPLRRGFPFTNCDIFHVAASVQASQMFVFQQNRNNSQVLMKLKIAGIDLISKFLIVKNKWVAKIL